MDPNNLNPYGDQYQQYLAQQEYLAQQQYLADQQYQGPPQQHAFYGLSWQNQNALTANNWAPVDNDRNGIVKEVVINGYAFFFGYDLQYRTFHLYDEFWQRTPIAWLNPLHVNPIPRSQVPRVLIDAYNALGPEYEKYFDVFITETDWKVPQPNPLIFKGILRVVYSIEDTAPEHTHTTQQEFGKCCLAGILRHADMIHYPRFDDISRRQPFGAILEVHTGNVQRGLWAVVVDRRNNQCKFAARLLDANHVIRTNKVLFIEANGNEIEYEDFEQFRTTHMQGKREISHRVLMVTHTGYLVYFGAQNPFVLRENSYLIFAENHTVIWRRVFDTRREDKRELFLKTNSLVFNQEIVEGATIFHGIVQRDTGMAHEFILTGKGIAVLDMKACQRLITGSGTGGPSDAQVSDITERIGGMDISKQGSSGGRSSPPPQASGGSSSPPLEASGGPPDYSDLADIDEGSGQGGNEQSDNARRERNRRHDSHTQSGYGYGYGSGAGGSRGRSGQYFGSGQGRGGQRRDGQERDGQGRGGQGRGGQRRDGQERDGQGGGKGGLSDGTVRFKQRQHKR